MISHQRFMKMDGEFEKCQARRKRRNELFAELERRFNRLNAANETKAIADRSKSQPIGDDSKGLEFLGTAKPITTGGKMADMGISGRARCGKNPRSKRMDS